MRLAKQGKLFCVTLLERRQHGAAERFDVRAEFRRLLGKNGEAIAERPLAAGTGIAVAAVGGAVRHRTFRHEIAPQAGDVETVSDL